MLHCSNFGGHADVDDTVVVLPEIADESFACLSCVQARTLQDCMLHECTLQECSCQDNLS